jgi:alpha-2-macroglobulin
VAVAAVDEGLLDMMGRCGYGVQSATAQMEVVGKRYYGLKALPQGGGGGKQPTRELFDTLLLWKGRVPLDAHGEASLEIPLNDSLTNFRIVAVATEGLDWPCRWPPANPM